jgi:hypothetical protein
MKNYIRRYINRYTLNFNEAAIDFLPFFARTALVAAVIPLLIGILVQDAGVITDPLEALHNLHNWCAAALIYPLAITGALVSVLALFNVWFTAVTLD